MANYSPRGSGGAHRPGGGFPGGKPGQREERRPPPHGEAEDRDLAALLRPGEPIRYFVANGEAARKELFDKEAEDVAKELATLPASQLRRFYGEVMALKRRLELDAELKISDAEIQARLALLKAEAAYTYKRGNKYPPRLVRFFTDHAASVSGRKDFLRGFQPHFEAVVAFHKFYERKGGNP